jgi:hypothetical protein
MLHQRRFDRDCLLNTTHTQKHAQTHTLSLAFSLSFARFPIFPTLTHTHTNSLQLAHTPEPFNCRISDVSLEAISSKCANLTRLMLRNCDAITDRGLLVHE